MKQHQATEAHASCIQYRNRSKRSFGACVQQQPWRATPAWHARVQRAPHCAAHAHLHACAQQHDRTGLTCLQQEKKNRAQPSDMRQQTLPNTTTHARAHDAHAQHQILTTCASCALPPTTRADTALRHTMPHQTCRVEHDARSQTACTHCTHTNTPRADTTLRHARGPQSCQSTVGMLRAAASACADNAKRRQHPTQACVTVR